MPTLHKFKLLATHCAVAGSSTPSPTASPVIHFRHRKTLRMLLNRPDRQRFSRCEGESEFDDIAEDPKEINYKEARVRRKLKDLFVSSPPIEDKRCELEEQQELLPSAGGSACQW
ncbi:50S ribosomal protein-like protein [Quillaja saponaria]|uniref:50S ribosomal protein-like protein n=1 Tax=Quillaja saponaria TaxID=32244 RepID=A0AAD7PXX9_QUISA|nr:50S ribosomal protein-like protein [Quillaja saponaria]